MFAVHVHRKKIFSAAAALLCTALLLSVCVFPAAAVEANDTVRFGFFRSEKYGYIGADGDLRGYDVHLSKTIGMYGGFDAEMIGYDTVTEMEDALRSGEVDVLIDFLRTEKREQEFIFTENPIMEEKVSLYTRNAPDAPTLNSITEAGELRIGCVPNSGFLDYFLDYCAEWNVTPHLVDFDDENEMRTAMDLGETDACLTGSVVPAGYRVLVSTVSLYSYMMLRADSSALCHKIDLAISQLNTDHPHYISNLYQQYVASRVKEMSPLTRLEREYLAEHSEFSVAVVRGTEPFVLEKNDGALGGILPAYYRTLGEKLGVSFSFELYDKTQDAINAVASGEADVLGHYYGDIIIADKDGLYNTVEYGDTDSARLSRSGFSGPVRTAAATERTIYLLTEQLGTDIQIKAYPNVETCYRAMTDGDVDTVIGSMTAITWLVNQHSLHRVNITVLPEISIGVRGAVSRDNRTLLFILNKAIEVSHTDLDEAIIENAASGAVSLRTALENLPLGFSFGVVSVLTALVVLLIITLIRLARSNRERVAMLNREIDVDTLTGAGSRRHGTVLMNRDLLLFNRYGEGPMLAMFDVDYFKEKNDTYGHEYGDFVLKKIVDVLHATLRQSDALIRWGGDEFILICPNVQGDGVDSILAKVVAAINSTDFFMDGKGEKVTVSVGASFFLPGDESIDAVLRRCDKALYEAKRVRNTYRVYSSDPQPCGTAGN